MFGSCAGHRQGDLYERSFERSFAAERISGRVVALESTAKRLVLKFVNSPSHTLRDLCSHAARATSVVQVRQQHNSQMR